MKINAESLVSISEANQNFSGAARLADEKGTAVILKNSALRYELRAAAFSGKTLPQLTLMRRRRV
jgi:hypothetical protein